MSQDNDDDKPKINGHKPIGLLPTALAGREPAGAALGDNLPFNVDEVLTSVTRLHAEVPTDAYTAETLGTEREGNGIVIDDNGLVLTIGYLIVEAMAVSLQDIDGNTVPAEVVAYDFESGFGLVRAMEPLGRPPVQFGSAKDLPINSPVLVVGSGGRDGTIGAVVVSKRPFAGYWEYMLDEAIFTAPPHTNWGGTALIGYDGALLGVGSLYVEDARQDPTVLAGNMFVPIDLLPPVLDDLMRLGRTATPPRPWLGMFAAESEGQVHVVATADNAPAAASGLKPGDVVVKIGDTVIHSMIELYKAIWQTGPAGAGIPFTILRGDIALRIEVTSEDRYKRLKFQRSY
jgi:S1-C subfamily serine protease